MKSPVWALAGLHACGVFGAIVESIQPIASSQSNTIARSAPVWPVEPDIPDSGANIVKKRYGPFHVPANSDLNPPLWSIAKPCESCWITAMQGGLEFEDGRIANVDSGAWLHHMMVYRVGWGKPDLTCPKNWGERVYSVGNEREVSRINKNADIALKLDATDRLGAMPELMNESSKPITVYIIMKYEILSNAEAKAQKYKPMKHAWFDITPCGGDSKYPAAEGAYERVQKQAWIAPFNGRFNYATGHLHDGGEHTTLYRRRAGVTEPICQSWMTYGGTPGYVGLDGMRHISSASSCYFETDGDIRKGDAFFVGATYNTSQHMLMAGKKEALEPIMGISRAYIVVES